MGGSMSIWIKALMINLVIMPGISAPLTGAETV
jgi:hypothetical protein